MRLREAHVPVLLWICAAALLHFGGAEESDHLAAMHDAKVRLRQAARELAEPTPPPMEVETLDFIPLEPGAEIEAEAKAPPEEAPPEVVAKDDKKKEEEKNKAAPKAKPPTAPEPEKEKKNETKVTVVVPPTPPPPAAPAPPPPPDKKISVQQHQDKDEEKNDEAKYLAEKNHKVKPEDETHASITSTTENNKDPNPGTHAGAPDHGPGNGDKNQVAHDTDRPGEKVAPNVVPKAAAVPPSKTSPSPTPGTKNGDDKKLASGPKAPPSPPGHAPQKSSDGKGLTAPGPGAPEVVAGVDGSHSVPPASSGPMGASSAKPGLGDGKAKSLPTLPTPGGPKWVAGVGAGYTGDGGNKLLPNEKIAKAVIGQDELDRLKKVEGETKLSIHRGAWKSSSLEKWRAAIENYTPGVKAGNQTNLGTAAAPWATYLSQIHVRLHPIFADGFVESLGDLPATHPLNDKTLVTRMEIVMKADGSLHHLGIVKPSGNTAFDIAALDAVDRAAPFGKAPTQIVSPDGLVYLHWEFHRDDQRCSNVNAYPYLLKEGQTPKPMEPGEPSKPKPPPEGEKKLGLAPSKPFGG